MDNAGKPILLSHYGAVATVTLNRPDKLNAWTPAMEIELRRVMLQLSADDSVRAIVLTGSTLQAEEAERIGLVSAVFEAESFAAEVADRARVIATTVSPRSARIIKRQLHESAAQSLAHACQVAAVEVTAAIVSEDFREGVQHFLEKRPAAFTGR